MAELPKLGLFAEIITDSYFIIDANHSIVDFNQAFYSMLPRNLARNLLSKKCHEVLHLDICEGKCIAMECWNTKQHAIFSEIKGQIVGQEEDLRFIVSAVPFFDEDGTIIGAMEIQRDVTVEASVQDKYQQQMESFNRYHRRLKEALVARGRQLLELNRSLRGMEKEVFRMKTDLCD